MRIMNEEIEKTGGFFGRGRKFVRVVFSKWESRLEDDSFSFNSVFLKCMHCSHLKLLKS